MNYKKIGMPWYFGLVKNLFKLIEIVFPPLANYWAWKFFITPLKFPYPDAEKPFYHQASKSFITYDHKQVAVYRWGNEAHPKVMVMHGWSSRATQFLKFIEALTQAGFEVIGIDAPAHGKSDGKETDLFGFAGVMKQVHENEGDVYAIIGHSLGGVASTIHVKNGMHVERLVIMASPSIAEDILSSFVRRINAFPARASYLRKKMKKIYKLDFEAATASEVVKNFPDVPTLLVYDKHDHEAPWRHGELLLNQMPKATLHKTTGLGHTRILKDKDVVKTVVDFLKK